MTSLRVLALRAHATLAVAAILAAGALAGCLPGSGASLDGRDFLSVGVTIDGADRPLVAGTRIRLSFMPGSLGATAGCNHIGGSYRVDGGRLAFEGAGMTEMGCDPARHAQDDWLVAFLSSRPALQLDGNDLVLTSGTTSIRLLDRRVADPDRPLAGPTWTLVAIIGAGGADGAVSSIPDGVLASLVFHDDGSVDVRTGCNDGSGRWALDGSGLRFSAIGLTKRGCDGAEAQVEAAMLAVLNAASVDATIQADGLTLRGAGGGLQLLAR